MFIKNKKWSHAYNKLEFIHFRDFMIEFAMNMTKYIYSKAILNVPGGSL